MKRAVEPSRVSFHGTFTCYPKLQIKIIPRTFPFCLNVRSISTVSKDFCCFSNQELELLFRAEGSVSYSFSVWLPFRKSGHLNATNYIRYYIHNYIQLYLQLYSIIFTKLRNSFRLSSTRPFPRRKSLIYHELNLLTRFYCQWRSANLEL